MAGGRLSSVFDLGGRAPESPRSPPPPESPESLRSPGGAARGDGVQDHTFKDPEAAAAHLYEHGVVVVPMSTEVLSNAVFDEVLQQLPEFKAGADGATVDLEYGGKRHTVHAYTLGGFGAINTPGATHHRAVRAARYAVREELLEVFRELENLRADDADRDYAALPKRRIQVLFDRLCVRAAKSEEEVTAEAWHRDEGDTSGTDDIFGGWLALQEQAFSCIPGTHIRGARKKAADFTTIDVRPFLAAGHAPQLVRVPAQHVVLFYQNIVHEVAKPKGGRRARRAAGDSRRLFTGFRLTPNRDDFLNYRDVMKTLGAAPTPCGFPTRMYARLHWTNGLPKLLAWGSARLRDGLLVDRVRGSDGKTYRVPPESFRDEHTKEHPELRGLRAMSAAKLIKLPKSLYPAYSKEEQALMLPHNL